MSQAAGADRTSFPTNGPQALRYRVKGMDCPTCAGKIETAVSRLPGVADVRVNYGSQILDLALDEEAGGEQGADEDAQQRLPAPPERRLRLLRGPGGRGAARGLGHG